MPNYLQAKIYKIECNVTNDVYYGSTTTSLSHRISKHKSDRNCSSINIIDRGNFNMKVIEEYPCDSKVELETRERWYIENNVCINKNIPGRTRKEYYEDNKEFLAQKNKEYCEDKEYYKKRYEQNKEKIKAHNLTKIKCECGCEVARCVLARHRRNKKHADLLNQA